MARLQPEGPEARRISSERRIKDMAATDGGGAMGSLSATAFFFRGNFVLLLSDPKPVHNNIAVDTRRTGVVKCHCDIWIDMKGEWTCNSAN